MDNSKRGYLLIGTGITLSREDCPKTLEERERMSRIPYASVVGAIMYTMTCTRPNVAYTLGVTSRYQSNLGEEYWKVVNTILKYLRRTKDQFLIYGDSELKLESYTNASFSSDRDDSKSISGYVFILNGGVVSWKSSRQAIVADSVTEAEYIAVSEAVWMKKFLTELGIVPSIEEIIERGDIEIQKVDGKENAADPFTKALGAKKFDKHKWKLGIKYKSDWL
ncbi:secreted RxLR effector protein 161-like [Nicotiana sylvestris]|uniref:secreted RxLR effector protein 161-like n=1 Tax=Nicotiana sylvestris TaxID=4096 RepID=UPI00388C94EB